MPQTGSMLNVARAGAQIEKGTLTSDWFSIANTCKQKSVQGSVRKGAVLYRLMSGKSVQQRGGHYQVTLGKA